MFPVNAGISNIESTAVVGHVQLGHGYLMAKKVHRAGTRGRLKQEPGCSPARVQPRAFSRLILETEIQCPTVPVECPSQARIIRRLRRAAEASPVSPAVKQDRVGPQVSDIG